MALFLIMIMILGIRLFGFIVRTFGKLIGTFFGVFLVMIIIGGLLGLITQFLPFIVICLGVYLLVHRSEMR